MSTTEPTTDQLILNLTKKLRFQSRLTIIALTLAVAAVVLIFVKPSPSTIRLSDGKGNSTILSPGGLTLATDKTMIMLYTNGEILPGTPFIQVEAPNAQARLSTDLGSGNFLFTGGEPTGPHTMLHLFASSKSAEISGYYGNPKATGRGQGFSAYVGDAAGLTVEEAGGKRSVLGSLQK